MDYKDNLAIIIVVAFVFVVGKFFPNNPLSMLGNYIKSLFVHEKAPYYLFGNMLTPLVSINAYISHDINEKYEYVEQSRAAMKHLLKDLEVVNDS